MTNEESNGTRHGM